MIKFLIQDFFKKKYVSIILIPWGEILQVIGLILYKSEVTGDDGQPF